VASVTRKSKTGRARRGTVERLVYDAVERLLADGTPYTALGIQRIADEAGVARSSFYLHFADKTDLLIRLGESSTEELFGVAERWLAEGADATPDSLRRAVAEVIEQRRRHAGALAALDEVAAYDDGVASFWKTRIERFAALVERRLVEARDDLPLDRVGHRANGRPACRQRPGRRRRGPRRDADAGDLARDGRLSRTPTRRPRSSRVDRWELAGGSGSWRRWCSPCCSAGPRPHLRRRRPTAPGSAVPTARPTPAVSR
jgi:AcrR family transcriptional regulator